MTDMANNLCRKSLVYDALSFLDYDWHCPRLDTEWLLSTLFDASLLSTSKAAGNGGSFFVSSAAILCPHTLETINPVVAGLSTSPEQ
jgi:hypothetical protein